MPDPFTPPQDPQGYSGRAGQGNPQPAPPPAYDPNAPYGYPPYYSQPPQAGQPGPYMQPYIHRTTNGMAIASMVLGIVWIYWIGSVLALVFGYIARRQIRERGQAGDGMAIAGIVLGWIGVGVFLLVMALFIIGSASSPDYSSNY